MYILFYFILIDDIDDVDDDQNVTYSKLTSATRSGVINERDRIYDQVPRSYTDNGHIQGKKFVFIQKRKTCINV